MARVVPNPHGGPDYSVGPTLFLCDGRTPGIELERVMDTMDRNYVEGHGVVRFDNLTLPASAVLGEVGQALRYAQMRLAPARLTHCMRWLGAAERAQSIAIEHARTRTAFGKPLAEHEGVSFMLADNEIALQQSRLAIWWACWTLDQGAKGRHESSMVKAVVSEDLFKVADRCVQVLGGMGISDETPVGMIFSDMRAFRLYDGPTEVHKYAIARQVLRDRAMSVLDSFRLDDKVVIVTGASSGLGVSFAQAFAEAGADLVLGARRVEKMAADRRTGGAGRPAGLHPQNRRRGPRAVRATGERGDYRVRPGRRTDQQRRRRHRGAGHPGDR